MRREQIAYAAVRWLLRWGSRSNLVAHAESELGPVGGKDGPDLWMHHHLLAMVRLFSLEGHSGASASIARGMLDRLLAFEPLGALTGEEGEWSKDTLDGETYQNRRCSHVFMKGGTAYDINGFVFREPDGLSFTGRESFRVVLFPYTPTCITVDVPDNSTPQQRLNALRSAGVEDGEIWCAVAEA